MQKKYKPQILLTLTMFFAINLLIVVGAFIANMSARLTGIIETRTKFVIFACFLSALCKSQRNAPLSCPTGHAPNHTTHKNQHILFHIYPIFSDHNFPCIMKTITTGVAEFGRYLQSLRRNHITIYLAESHTSFPR